jgi:type III secretion protein Q
MNAPTGADLRRLLGPQGGDAVSSRANEWQPVVMSQLGRLRIDPSRLPAVEAVYSGHGSAQMVLGGQAYLLQWKCPPVLARAPLLLSLRTRSGGVQLALDVHDVFAFWPAEDFPIPKGLLAIHLLEECSLLLKWVEDAFNTVITGLEISDHPAPFRPLLSLAVTNASTRHEGWVHVLSLPTAWNLKRLKQQRTRASAAELQQTLSLRMRLQVGQTVISTRELRALEVGDILIMDKWVSVGNQLRIDGYVEDALPPLLVMWANEQHATVGSINLQGFPMQRNETNSDAISNEHVDELEVTLTFHLGERRIKLGELQDIRPGYVFELENSLNRSSIRVAVNGTNIASGQLMAVGERLGVRVTRITGPMTGRE